MGITEEKARELLARVADTIDLEKIPLDDKDTYDLLSTGNTDGIFMMESDWDKYDLRQIQPSDFDELTACLALSHSMRTNPYIYTYLKMQKVKPFTYPRYTEMEAVNEILKDSHGMLLYREQAEAINDYLACMSDEDRMRHKMAIRIITSEIKRRKGTLSHRAFFRERALLCYRMAYVKAHQTELFGRLLHVLGLNT